MTEVLLNNNIETKASKDVNEESSREYISENINKSLQNRFDSILFNIKNIKLGAKEHEKIHKKFELLSHEIAGLIIKNKVCYFDKNTFYINITKYNLTPIYNLLAVVVYEQGLNYLGSYQKPLIIFKAKKLLRFENIFNKIHSGENNDSEKAFVLFLSLLKKIFVNVSQLPEENISKAMRSQLEKNFGRKKY